MAFNELQMKAMSESALFGIHKELVRLQDFAHQYSELETQAAGIQIAIPVYDLSAASLFDATNNNYASGAQEVDGAVLTLNQHLVKSISITDIQLAETGLQWSKDAGTAIAKVLGRGLNKLVFNQLNETNIPLSAEINLGTKAGVANLYKIAADVDLDVNDTVAVLNPTQFAKVLTQFDYMAYGGPEAVRGGYVPQAFGLASILCSGDLPDGVDGVLIGRNSIGIGSRALAPMPGAYVNTWKAVDPDSGFTVSFREFCDLPSGKRFIAGEALVGTKIFYGGRKAIRLIAQ